MKTLFKLFILTLLLFPVPSWAQYAGPFGYTGVFQSATLMDAATNSCHSHATGVTCTLTPGAGQYIYVTGIDISNCATGTAVTAAAPTYITTTNLTGSPQWQLGSGVTAGLCQPTDLGKWTKPIKSTAAGTAVTFVLPAFATNQVVSLNVHYYSAP